MTYVIWEVNKKSFWQEMSWRLWEPCEYLGHSNILWNYLEVNYIFWIKGNLWALYVLPMCCDMWLLGDYLARYYSLCDISVLAPIFVMVISSGFVSTIVMWPWVRFSGLEWCCYCSQCIIRSFMMRYFEEYIVCNFMRTSWEALCRVNLFILVILFLEMVL